MYGQTTVLVSSLVIILPWGFELGIASLTVLENNFMLFPK